MYRLNMITSRSFWVRGKFGSFCLLIQALMVILFAIFVDYDDNAHALNKYRIMEAALTQSHNATSTPKMLIDLDMGMIERANSSKCLFRRIHFYQMGYLLMIDSGIGIVEIKEWKSIWVNEKSWVTTLSLEPRICSKGNTNL